MPLTRHHRLASTLVVLGLVPVLVACGPDDDPRDRPADELAAIDLLAQGSAASRADEVALDLRRACDSRRADPTSRDRCRETYLVLLDRTTLVAGTVPGLAAALEARADGDGRWTGCVDLAGRVAAPYAEWQRLLVDWHGLPAADAGGRDVALRAAVAQATPAWEAWEAARDECGSALEG